MSIKPTSLKEWEQTFPAIVAGKCYAQLYEGVVSKFHPALQ
jgi:hypothetical protein